ncbi:ABC-F family ATP-binding cassette domain-containing protein [bacterium]|nr:ABC-F family ATP-binding cassette domain-containing protein [bacterium]
MAILEVRDLKFGYTDIELYNSISFDLNQGEHAVIVGPNGIGKSTFMKIIAGKLVQDSGDVKWLTGVRYSYLDQQLEIKKDISIGEYLHGVYEDLFKREIQMNKIYNSISNLDPSEIDVMLNRAESIREYLEINDFYNIETEINNVVIGLGLGNIDMKRLLSSLSGGEKGKVYLAKLLLEKADCILMDEPTNFLDKSHVSWLGEYLNNYKGTFLVISHDQEFLKVIAKVVFAFEAKSLVKYKGNYDYYLNERGLRHTQQLNAYNRQQDFIKKTQIFIQKNIVRKSTTKQAQSRRKMLEKLNIIEKPTEEYRVHITFPYSKDMGQEALKMNDLSIGYDSPLLPEITYLMKKNERMEIIGKNGIGKSTLIKTLLGEIKSLGGSFIFNPSVTINYFSQEEEIDLDKTPIDYIRMKYPLKTLEECLKTLAPLGIRGDLARKKMKELSGGELGRVRLSLMTLKKSNFLILDEPTNHLDKLSKEALHDAIDAFPGAVILVSHEVGFADDLVDTIIKF